MAPAYMSPTERPSWSAMTISTSDGGMICASVPEAVMTPVAMRPVVAVAQHDGQRDQAHRDHRRRDHAGGRRQQRADEDHRQGQAAAHRAEHLADGFQQILGHAAALEDDAHEREERDRQQRVVLHDAEYPQRQGLEQRRPEQAGLHADEAESQAGGRQAEGDRKAGEQEDKQARRTSAGRSSGR